MKKAHFSIVIPAYNCEKYIDSCLSAIFKTIPSRYLYKTIVINNNSQDHTAKILKKYSNKIIIIENSVNLGYAKACNQGIKYSEGEFVYFLNTDTIVKPHAIEKLYLFLKNNKEAAVAGSLLLTPNQIPEKWQMGYEKTLFRVIEENLLDIIFQIVKPKWLFKFAPLINLNYANLYVLREVGWVNGASIMIRKKILEDIGGYEEKYFIYYEEMDFQIQLKKLGWKIYHIPSSVVIHYGQGSRMNQYMKISRELFYEKHYGLIGKYLTKLKLLFNK